MLVVVVAENEHDGQHPLDEYVCGQAPHEEMGAEWPQILVEARWHPQKNWRVQRVLQQVCC